MLSLSGVPCTAHPSQSREPARALVGEKGPLEPLTRSDAVAVAANSSARGARVTRLSSRLRPTIYNIEYYDDPAANHEYCGCGWASKAECDRGPPDGTVCWDVCCAIEELASRRGLSEPAETTCGCEWTNAEECQDPIGETVCWAVCCAVLGHTSSSPSEEGWAGGANDEAKREQEGDQEQESDRGQDATLLSSAKCDAMLRDPKHLFRHMWASSAWELMVEGRGLGSCWNVARDGDFEAQGAHDYFDGVLGGSTCLTNWYEGTDDGGYVLGGQGNIYHRQGGTPSPALLGFDGSIDVFCQEALTDQMGWASGGQGHALTCVRAGLDILSLHSFRVPYNACRYVAKQPWSHLQHPSHARHKHSPSPATPPSRHLRTLVLVPTARSPCRQKRGAAPSRLQEPGVADLRRPREASRPDESVGRRRAGARRLCGGARELARRRGRVPPRTMQRVVAAARGRKGLRLRDRRRVLP